jgi:GNAT superfamily N-acetyltransferase
MSTSAVVVELGPGDWAELRDIRLRALADAPDAFSVVLAEAEARGRGHSSAVLDRVVTWARAVGRTPHLHVTEGNDAARRLYVRRGFEPTGTWEPLREGSPKRVEELVLSRG